MPWHAFGVINLLDSIMSPATIRGDCDALLLFQTIDTRLEHPFIDANSMIAN